MRLWLFALSLILLPWNLAFAQDPFPGNTPPKFTYRETFKDVVVMEPDTLPEDMSFIVGRERTISIEGTAPLTGFDLSEIDEDSLYGIAIGNFDTAQIPGLQGRLSDDENFDSTSDRSISIPVTAFNYDGDEVTIGSVGINWTPTRVEFLVNIGNLNQPLTEVDFDVGADFYRDSDEPAIDAEDMTASFTFGPFGYNLRTVYTTGSSSTRFDDMDRVPDTLSTVNLQGAIDYLAPAVTITNPAPNATTSEGTINITGTATDQREIGSTKYAGEIYSVEVQVGSAEFVEADVTGNNWVLPNVTLEAGANNIVVRVTDVDGNITTTSPRKVTFQTRGPVTVRATAEGYDAGASGTAGTVSGAFFTGTSKKITAVIGGPAEENTKSSVDAGTLLTVVATPAPGSVFNGWVGSINGEEKFTAVSETLTFEAKPQLLVVAKFTPNPFPLVLGSYQGLVNGDERSERGVFKIGISKTGAFTGKVQVGALTLPIKGKVLGTGFWQGTVKKGGVIYTVSFTLNVSGTGDSQLTGTVKGGAIDASIVADLKTWRAPKKGDPGNLATDYLGTYNILFLPPTIPGPGVPEGIGYGRVTISKLGGVVFVGKLGDGSPARATSILIERNSGGVTFPLFIALDKKQGSILGEIVYDATQPTTDLTGTLTWAEPNTGGIEPQTFSTTVEAQGARYVKPLAGERVILQSTSGAGEIELSSPEYTVPTLPIGQPFFVSAGATLDPAQTVTIASTPQTQGLNFKMKFNANTGLFSGTFKDPQLKKTINLSGAAVRKGASPGVAGGVFIRGNRTGAVWLAEP